MYYLKRIVLFSLISVIFLLSYRECIFASQKSDVAYLNLYNATVSSLLAAGVMNTVRAVATTSIIAYPLYHIDGLDKYVNRHIQKIPDWMVPSSFSGDKKAFATTIIGTCGWLLCEYIYRLYAIDIRRYTSSTQAMKLLPYWRGGEVALFKECIEKKAKSDDTIEYLGCFLKSKFQRSDCLRMFIFGAVLVNLYRSHIEFDKWKMGTFFSAIGFASCIGNSLYKYACYPYFNTALSKVITS